MKKFIFFGVGLLIGAGAGAGVSYIFTKNSCEKRCQEAIDEMKHFYEDGTHKTVKGFELKEGSDEKTENSENLKEELGDLLLQVLMHSQIAEEEGYFTLDDVIVGIAEKMIRRHPHVFGKEKISTSAEVLENWEEIKKKEKEGKEAVNDYLPEAFNEAMALIDTAKKRKGYCNDT